MPEEEDVALRLAAQRGEKLRLLAYSLGGIAAAGALVIWVGQTTSQVLGSIANNCLQCLKPCTLLICNNVPQLTVTGQLIQGILLAVYIGAIFGIIHYVFYPSEKKRTEEAY